jgi:hypothetical protein
VTNNEKILVSKLLLLASDRFARAMCNDTPDSVVEHLSQEEMVEINRSFHQWNGDIEEFNPGYGSQKLPDFAYCGYYAHKILEEAS